MTQTAHKIRQALIIEDLPDSQALLLTVCQQTFPGVTCQLFDNLHDGRLWLTENRCDLLLIDLGLPDGDGTDLIAEVKQSAPDCTIVVATIFDDDQHLFAALQAGAMGYLLKDQSTAQLVRQLQGIEDGQPPLSASIARRLLNGFQVRAQAQTQPAQHSLSQREQEVLGLIARGFSSNEISGFLEISRHTVGDHIKNIYRKLNISSRAEATREALRLGLG
ncbi:response regulator [Parathalassolituus penaei]|uniref:Response regulator transcription factor n=1 Tax=Parathalassolituus penaei TaxID=2997323 RepID=A0A9X3ECP2_9GAMM|nr:response regulator transcription factor [Parathalassolituus penaei]MCY0964384.1 response regulator transcription factor [Parathalassolituus penaei]